MSKNYLELAKKRRLTKNNITEEHIKNLNISNFVCLLYDRCDPASYGKQMEVKLIHDTNHLIKKIATSEEMGEFLIGGKKVEMKTSYLGKNGTYRLANMRDWQKVDYFCLFLVDSENDFQLRVYLVDVKFIFNNCSLSAMDNSKKINDANNSYNKGTNFRPKFLEDLNEVNILRGNTYEDLKDYIFYMNGKPTENGVSKLRKVSKRNKATKVSFIVNGVHEVNGKTNRETVAKLSQLLGYENIVGKFWDSQLSTQQDKTFTISIGGGYYLNPKFSIRDIRNNINMLNQKTNFNVRVVEKLKNYS